MPCDFSNYTQFLRQVVDSDSTQVRGANRIQVGLRSANGANQLWMFSGVALVEIGGGAENQLLLGKVEIILDLELGAMVQFMNGNAYAGLAGIENTGYDVSGAYGNTYAIDCVSVAPQVRAVAGKTKLVPVIEVAAGHAGVAGYTTLHRIAYQANLELKVGLDFLVGLPGTGFGATVTLTAGGFWDFRIDTIVPAPSPNGWTVMLQSLQPEQVPVPAQVTIPANQTSGFFQAPATQKFSAPPPERSVRVVATLEGLTATATVNVKANP